MPSTSDLEAPAGRRPVVVVPCYDEASRIDGAEMRRLAETVDVWLVDDGSKDSTRSVLEAIAAQSGGLVAARRNEANRGKGETVRVHMLAACESGPPVVGFFDADLATPVDEMLGLLGVLESRDADAVTAARVALSGRDIQRSGARHYTGRVFSTVASLAIGATYYDTQCGAKVFRNTAALRAALSEPFVSRWAFDVELLGRLLAGSPGVAAVPPGKLVEHPIERWRDIAGSKLTLGDAWASFAQLFAIWRDLARRRSR